MKKGNVSATISEMDAYFKHFCDSLRFDGTIFGDVGAIDSVGIRVGITLLIWLVVAEFREDGLRDVSVPVVYENASRHTCCEVRIILTNYYT